MSKKAKATSTKQKAVKTATTVSVADFERLMKENESLKADLIARDETIFSLQRSLETLESMKSAKSTGILNKTKFLSMVRWIAENVDQDGWIEHGEYMTKYGFTARQATKDWCDVKSRIGQHKSIGFWFMVLGLLPIDDEVELDFTTMTETRKLRLGIQPSFKIERQVAENCVSNAQWRDAQSKRDQVEYMRSLLVFSDDQLFPMSEDGKRRPIDFADYLTLLKEYVEKHSIVGKLDSKLKK